MTYDQKEAERFLCEADSLLNTFAKANGLTFKRLTAKSDGHAWGLAGRWGMKWLIVCVLTTESWASFEQARIRYYLLTDPPKDFDVCNKRTPLRTIVRGADDLLTTIAQDLMHLRSKTNDELRERIIPHIHRGGFKEAFADPDNEPTEPDDETPK